MKINKSIKLLFIVITIIIVFLCIKYFHLPGHIVISYLQNHLQFYKQVVEKHYFVSVIVYITIYLLASAFSIPGSSIFTVVSGMFFNIFPGIFYAIIAATAGSTILFLFSRYMVGQTIQKRYANHLKRFNYEMKLYGKYYLFVIRLVGLLPFGFVTMLSSVTILPLKQFIIMTMCGIFPVSLIYVYTGFKLASMCAIEDICSATIMGPSVFVIVSKVLFLPIVIKFIHWRSKGHSALI